MMKNKKIFNQLVYKLLINFEKKIKFHLYFFVFIFNSFVLL